MREDIKLRIETVRRGEAPDGYSDSIASVLPNDWTSKPLSEISEVLSEQAGNGSYETLSISAGIGFVNQAEKFGKELSGKQYAKYTVLRKGDFAYNKGNSKRYPQGCTYMLRERDEAAVPNVFECFRITEGYPEYYEQLFISGFMNRQLTRKINHGVRDDGLLNLTDDDFYSTVLPVPPLAEQQKIAEILSTCDRVIELKQQLLDEKRKQKQWLMQMLLDPNSGVRLPGCTEKWKQLRLRDLGSFSKGSGISNDDCSSGDCPCIKYGDIYVAYGEYFADAVSHTEENIFEKTPTVSEGALLFTGSGEDPKEIGKCTVYLGNEPIAVGGDIIIMNPKRTMVNPLFLAYALNAYPAIKQKACLGQGYSIVHIYGEDIEKISVYVPPTIEEQERIAEIIKESNSAICLIEDEIAEWQQKKKALMQLLLTGLVRVNA